jgi:NADPH:quinone reductase-like Zn-dependent oxidoreductase
MLAPGDEVMGFIGIVGAFAARAVVDAARLARKPASLGFLEAAAVPAASLNGLAGAARVWRVAGRSDSSDSCRSGGVGSVAVQLARLAGAHVSATASAGNRDYVQSLGATDVIDYNENILRRAHRNLMWCWTWWVAIRRPDRGPC